MSVFESERRFERSFARLVLTQVFLMVWNLNKALSVPSETGTYS